jgi:hypothetical protein
MYKNINQVMNAQQDLVDILGTFQPRIVRMDNKWLSVLVDNFWLKIITINEQPSTNNK